MAYTRLTLPLTFINFELKTALPLTCVKKFFVFKVVLKKNLVQLRYKPEKLPWLT